MSWNVLFIFDPAMEYLVSDNLFVHVRLITIDQREDNIMYYQREDTLCTNVLQYAPVILIDNAICL